MRKELALSYSLISFESLEELLVTLDEYMELHDKASEKYGDRLGNLLRRNGVAEDSLQTAAQIESPEPEQKKSSGFMGGRKDKKSDDRKISDERGWISIGGEEFSIKVASGFGSSTSANEVSVLFKIVEQLKSKTAALQQARKLLADLPTQGFRADQRLLVVFKDGLPRQVIPTNEISAQQKRFRYSEQFRATVLEEIREF